MKSVEISKMLKQILRSKSVETFKALLPIQILVPCKLIVKWILKLKGILTRPVLHLIDSI